MTTLALLVAFASPLTFSQGSTFEHGPALDGASAASSSILPSAITENQVTGLGQALILDEPGDGRTWARGPRWKASFGDEGLTYIPFLGSDAPRNYPVEFNLAAVSIAGESIPIEGRLRFRSGGTVTLDRGSMSEVYHLTKDAVEQTFVFEALPQRGDLVLDVRVTSDLALECLGSGFRFFNELGEVRYGAATAIDADGKSLPLQQQLTDQGFRIMVPEEFVSAASLPLVVDPIITTIPVTNNSRRQIDLDVAHEGQNSTYQIVYSELQSAADVDVIAVSYNAPLNLLLPAVSIDTTSSSWNMPRNASCYHEEQFLCVSVVGNSIGSRRVWGRTRHAGTGVRGAQFPISGVGAEYVDVGGKGNITASSYDYMVVWQEVDSANNDFDIVAQAVRGDSTLTAGRVVIDGDVTDLDRYPSISKSTGHPTTSNANNEYMVVWEREISPTNHNIRAQVIEYTGSMSGHSQFNAYTFSDALNPDVSSPSTLYGYVAENHWLIAFERRIGSAYKIFTVIAHDGSADNARNVHVMQNLDVDGDHRDPHVAFDNFDYLVTYQTTESNGDHTAYLTALNIVQDDGELRTGLALRRELLGTSEGEPGTLAIGSYFDGGGQLGGAEPGDALALWLDRDDSTGRVDVQGAIVADLVGHVVGTQYCQAATNSTGTSAWIRAQGSAFSTFPLIRLECMDMPPNSFGHFLVSNQSGFVMNPGGSQGNLCLQGSVGRFNRPGEIMNSGSSGSFALPDVDPAQLPSPTGLVAAHVGETWYFQCWFRDVGPSSNFSNATEVMFD